MIKLKLWYIFLCQLVCNLIYSQAIFNIDAYISKNNLKNPIYYYQFADSLNGLHENETAILLLTKALKSTTFKNNQKELALSYLSLGDCFKDDQEYRNSITNFDKAVKIIKQLNDSALLIRAETSIAGSYLELGNTDSVLLHLKTAKLYSEKNPHKYYRYLTSIYNNYGSTYNAKFNFTESLNYFFKAIIISEKHKYKDGLYSTYNNLGNLYSDLGQWNKSLLYYHKVLALNYSSYTLTNIAILHSEIGNIDSSFYYIKKSIAINKKTNNKVGLSSSYMLVGNLHKKVTQIDSALYYYKLSTQLAIDLDDVNAIEYNNYNIVELLIEQKKYQEAKILAQKNLQSLLTGDDLSFIADSYNQLKLISSQLGDFKDAFTYQEQFIIYKDSAQKANKTIEIKKIELNAEYKKKSSNDSLLNIQKITINNIKHDEEIKKQHLILISFLLVLIIVAVFSIWIYKRYKVSQRQKEIINVQKNEMFQQKTLVEEKQKEIVDSIHYAKKNPTSNNH